ncbi:MAG: restriction endonuclease [Ignavibacteria bacterium]|nr:restriction endonuclease [Ignavibacteria bacterium]
METKLIEVGLAERKYNSSYSRILGYTVEMYHKGLNEHKILSAPDLVMLQTKVDLQLSKWTEKWETVELKKKNIEMREANLEEALARTENALEEMHAIDNLLLHTLSINDTINWNKLKDKRKFTVPSPAENLQHELEIITEPIKPTFNKLPVKPDKTDSIFKTKFTLLDKIFPSLRKKKELHANEAYNLAFENWEEKSKEIEKNNVEIQEKYELDLALWQSKREQCILKNKEKVDEWEKHKKEHYARQVEHNSKINELQDSYMNISEAAVLEYCQMVLNNSEYPEFFPQNFELEYNPETKILIVEYELPSIKDFPRTREWKYIASKKELKPYFIPDSELNKLFDEAIYKITLRSLHELFEADVAKALDSVSFNGWVNAVNKATGKEESNCIVSIQVRKTDFETIDLSKVDPKICFKNLKGVSSSKLSSLTPVQPLLRINKMDKRFVEGYNVVDGLDTSINIAGMDWEDFEHLIRELFEKEFSSNGGEVKVTQASRDGGVDAIAFDPDPIRGGKIVIQAKRYTNTVGVSAVRDLFGTVHNEGATKGILVTTADYGPDAYEFAKGKPLTLLTGSNLLFLLEKHGHHAKIDLREAKRVLAEKEKLE